LLKSLDVNFDRGSKTKEIQNGMTNALLTIKICCAKLTYSAPLCKVSTHL
jgi:hypothetical protein